MDDSNSIQITLYLCGEDEEDAQSHFVFDSFDSAKSYALDNQVNIYSVKAHVDFRTIESEAIYDDEPRDESTLY